MLLFDLWINGRAWSAFYLFRCLQFTLPSFPDKRGLLLEFWQVAWRPAAVIASPVASNPHSKNKMPSLLFVQLRSILLLSSVQFSLRQLQAVTKSAVAESSYPNQQGTYYQKTGNKCYKVLCFTLSSLAQFLLFLSTLLKHHQSGWNQCLDSLQALRLSMSLYSIANSSGFILGDHFSIKSGRSKILLIIYSVII